jgi:hypothetical protein
MKEPGEQCTVVYAFSVQEPLVNVCACVYMWRGRRGRGLLTCYTPSPLTGSVTIYAKTTVHCSPGSSMVVLFAL